LGYHFSDPGLLDRALTHRSASTTHMERLEFLGDAVLGLVVAEYLHSRFPDADEGSMSRMRASLVRREGLLNVASSWALFSCLYVGEGERTAGGIKSASIAANAVEAIIGAIFTDGGWKEARRVVHEGWQPLLAKVEMSDLRDAKSRLQELTQERGWGLPSYEITDHGPAHTPRFQARCQINAKQAGVGEGNRKKTAEMNAAEQAWTSLQDA